MSQVRQSKLLCFPMAGHERSAFTTVGSEAVGMSFSCFRAWNFLVRRPTDPVSAGGVIDTRRSISERQAESAES